MRYPIFQVGFMIGLLATMAGGSGCSRSASPYVKAGLSLVSQSRAAFLPFDNLTGQEEAGRKFDQVILVELLKQEIFDFANPGDVESALTEARVRSVQMLSAGQLRDLSQALEVDYVFIGSLLEYEQQAVSGLGTGSLVPLIAASLRLVDARTGEVLWAKNRAVRGDDHETVFQIGRVTSINKLSQTLAEDLARSLKHSLSIAPEESAPEIKILDPETPAPEASPLNPPTE